MADVTDNFNRGDNPTSLGTATTGEVWAQVAAQGAGGLFGNPYGIVSNTGFNAGTGGAAAGDSLVAVETGMNMTRGQVTLMNADAGTVENLRNQGILFNYVDDTHYIFLTYARAGGGLFRLYIADGGTATQRGPDCSVALNDGDTIGYAICGNTITALHNGIVAQNYPVTFTAGDVLSATLLAGTKCGLQAQPGTSDPGTLPIFENFSVVENDTCQTYDCSGGACVDPGDGTGEFSSLAACQSSCGVAPSYNCVDGVCCDPGDGLGTYATVVACQASGCGNSFQVDTFRFNAGNAAVEYYAAWQLSEGGAPKQDKEIRAIQPTGKLTMGEALVYGYSQTEPIPIQDIEDGINSLSGSIPLGSQSLPETLERVELNVSNAALFTARVGGTWDGTGEPDRIDKVEIEFQPVGMPR